MNYGVLVALWVVYIGLLCSLAGIDSAHTRKKEKTDDNRTEAQGAGLHQGDGAPG